MTTRMLEIYQIGDKQYVTTRGAARYLGISHDRLQGSIALGKLPAAQIESHQLIELESVKAFAMKRRAS